MKEMIGRLLGPEKVEETQLATGRERPALEKLSFYGIYRAGRSDCRISYFSTYARTEQPFGVILRRSPYTTRWLFVFGTALATSLPSDSLGLSLHTLAL